MTATVGEPTETTVAFDLAGGKRDHYRRLYNYLSRLGLSRYEIVEGVRLLLPRTTCRGRLMHSVAQLQELLVTFCNKAGIPLSRLMVVQSK